MVAGVDVHAHYVAPELLDVFRGADGERLGVVSQLLVDPTALKVRYADVDVHEDLFRLRDDRHVLVPLELIDLRERGKDAWVEGLTAAEVASLPAYSGGPVPPAMEMAVQDAFGRVSSRPHIEPSPDETASEHRATEHP